MNLVRTYLVKFPRQINPSPASRNVTPGPDPALAERARLEAEERHRRWEAQQRQERARQAAKQKAEAARREQEQLERQRVAAAQRQEAARQAAQRAAEQRRAAAARKARARQRRENLADLESADDTRQSRPVETLEEWPGGDEAEFTEEDDWTLDAPDQEWAGEFGEEAPSILSQTLQDTALQLADSYGPVTQVGQNLRIQAARGYRAGVMRLRNGMYLVLEIHESALDPQFGAASVLVPLAVNAAAKALTNERFQSAVVHTASEGVQAAGRGLSQLGHGNRRGRRPQEMAQAPHPAWPGIPGASIFPYPGYAPAALLPYGHYVPQPYALLPPVRSGQVQLQTALPWADGQDVARLEGWDDPND